MTVAKARINEWGKDGFKIVSPKESASKRKIIEVYPGTIRRCSSEANIQIKNILDKLRDESLRRDYGYYSRIPGVKKTDLLDSAICSILGMAYLVKDHPEITKIGKLYSGGISG